MAMLWTVMLSCRWPFVASIAALAIFHTNQRGGGATEQLDPDAVLPWGGGGATVLLDPEAVLPWVIHTHIPTPLKGIVVAGMLAAGMSTYDSAVNAAAAYWVKDLYLLFINPDASPRLQMLHSRAASAVLVVAATTILAAALVRDVNEIWGFITMGLTGGMLVPIVLRWYWWRLNGYGFAVGIMFGTCVSICTNFSSLTSVSVNGHILSGTCVSIHQHSQTSWKKEKQTSVYVKGRILSGTCVSICTKLFLPDVADYLLLFAALPVSLTLLLIVTFSTPPTSPQVLDKFYRNTRPWGPVTGKMRDPEGLRRVEVFTPNT
ncbi:hypothetical protein T484DRAFT_1761594 [Baffinella frigidus]|nr:hypothetical protein T484DRAFT_1761594 [Cryptophyta sp. CCMP2293]